MPSNRDPWQSLLGALRTARDSSPPADSADTPPPGFVSRVAARAAAARREQVRELWQRWSLRFAIGSCGLCAIAVCYALLTSAGDVQIVPLPALELPATP